MGFLDRFFKSGRNRLLPLPSGSFTLDREGRVMTSTLPQSFPEDRMREIGESVLNAFRSARQSNMPLTEIIVQFATLKVLARELRGGAIIFLMPQLMQNMSNTQKTSLPI
jgi:hypothetical protein